MTSRGFYAFLSFVVLATIIAILLAVAMAKPQPHVKGVPASQTDPHYVDVPTPYGAIPCIVYVNEYHAENGAAISCDWTKKK